MFENLGVLEIFKHNSAAYFALLFWLDFDEFEFLGIFNQKTRPANIGISVADADVEGRVHDVGITGVIVREEVIQLFNFLPLEIKALAMSQVIKSCVRHFYSLWEIGLIPGNPIIIPIIPHNPKLILFKTTPKKSTPMLYIMSFLNNTNNRILSYQIAINTKFQLHNLLFFTCYFFAGCAFVKYISIKT